MARYAVLFRGMNVGGATTVPMAGLREALSAEGFGDVATFLRSGNVVLTSDASAGDVAAACAGAAGRLAGRDFPALAVTAGHLRHALDRNPLWHDGMDGARMVTAFSDREPGVVGVPRNGLAPMGGGSVVIDTHYGLSLVHQWCPDGISSTPSLSEFVRHPDGAVVTARNRNTVAKLLERLGSA